MSMKYSLLFTFCCFALVFQSCTSDNSINLGKGYFYRDEGKDIKDILCENSKGGEIPATVLAYAYDNKFIIAKQRPKLPQDHLYKKDYRYTIKNNLFYWIIVKENNVVFGPLNMQEYKSIRLKYKIPQKLQLE